MNDLDGLRFCAPVGFNACSYLPRLSGERHRLVKIALETWPALLDLPFTERLFLDDRSPDASAIRLLGRLGLTDKFDLVRYQTIPHPPHSNFGIVAALEMGRAPYIVHIDDDVRVRPQPRVLFDLINLSLEVMEADQSIMGFNLLSGSADNPNTLPFRAGLPYAKREGLFHVRQFIGTCGCILRRELVARVPFSQIMAWGDQQPDVWEKLVSGRGEEIMACPLTTPLWTTPDTFYFKATHDKSAWRTMRLYQRSWWENFLKERRQRKRSRAVARGEGPAGG